MLSWEAPEKLLGEVTIRQFLLYSSSTPPLLTLLPTNRTLSPVEYVLSSALSQAHLGAPAHLHSTSWR